MKVFQICSFNNNVGDVAIRVAFKKMFENDEVTLMKTTRIYSEEDIDEINKHDLLLLAGGGVFLYDSFENIASDWQWGITPKLINKIKIPIIVHSIGYNKLRGQRDFNKLFDESVKALYDKAVFFSMRNTGSIEAVKKHIGECDIKLNFCPTLQKTLPNTGKNNVAFVIGGDRLQLRHPNMKEYIKQISIFVRYLNQHNIETILINHLKDVWIFNYIPFDKTIDMAGMDNDKVYDIYSNIDTVVSDRGHGQMIPLACGCRILSPISHDKNKWFLEDIGLEEFGIEESDPNLGEKLIEKYEVLQAMDWNRVQSDIINKINTTNKRNEDIIKHVCIPARHKV